MHWLFLQGTQEVQKLSRKGQTTGMRRRPRPRQISVRLGMRDHNEATLRSVSVWSYVCNLQWSLHLLKGGLWPFRSSYLRAVFAKIREYIQTQAALSFAGLQRSCWKFWPVWCTWSSHRVSTKSLLGLNIGRKCLNIFFRKLSWSFRAKKQIKWTTVQMVCRLDGMVWPIISLRVASPWNVT